MRVGAGELLVYYNGNWPAPYGIVLVADRLSALMLTHRSAFAGQSAVCRRRRQARFALPCAVPDAAARHQRRLPSPADLFNLFVFFEILLIASSPCSCTAVAEPACVYHPAYRELNLVGSAIFLIAIGAIYAATGTLNLADLAAKLAIAGSEQAGLLRAGGLLLLVVFALKAALIPLGFWLPAYAAAVRRRRRCSAIMTKVGVYAILRVHSLVFSPRQARWRRCSRPGYCHRSADGVIAPPSVCSPAASCAACWRTWLCSRPAL